MWYVYETIFGDTLVVWNPTRSASATKMLFNCYRIESRDRMVDGGIFDAVATRFEQAAEAI